MGELSPWHWLIVAVVVLVLFGSKKLPEAARSLGRSLRIFKSEVGGLRSDDEGPPPVAAAAPQASIDAAPGSAGPTGAGRAEASAETVRSGGDDR
ncbi:Sec-independent protein translocase subunit TatA [Actinoallomurus sp. NPDC052274]|uniref:Sec-independent protein translocase subunit TatA n=1 Tax=Actinoallomurus sp. NPDC052274 TaxID=3155420 RepID=UPI003433B1BC